MKHIILFFGIATSLLLSRKNDHSTSTTNMTRVSQTLSISINRPADEVYAYMANVQHLAAWAAGLCVSVIRNTGTNTWQIRTPTGEASVRFVAKNNFRIVDHYVQQGQDPEVYIPIRVLENEQGSEVIFTLFRLPGMNDERFEKDRQAVQKDLNTLKALIEAGAQ
ncbi:SRPBCC family protein [Paraflavitalea soli]|uniref:SRPBCC family protein n=1 Tax=Paraflavitalea soli TaxID=2315862 RepID=A0A3B7MP45_9BACT|nr:SRPBCC family protein [Paraflavitalea soli]AXY73335.1 SRPBCC family protein [Paraflavitalea soli]